MSILPPPLAVKVMFSVMSVGLSVHLSVCPLVNTLTAEPFDILTPNLLEGCMWTISRTSFILKVKCQGHQVKNVIFEAYNRWKWVQGTLLHVPKKLIIWWGYRNLDVTKIGHYQQMLNISVICDLYEFFSLSGAHGRFIPKQLGVTQRQARIQTLEPEPWMWEVEHKGHATRKAVPQTKQEM